MEVAYRAPTISFYHPTRSAQEICKNLSTRNIYAWDGHFYAIRAVEVLGLLESGGVTRMGISIYTEEEEIDKTIQVVSEMLDG